MTRGIRFAIVIMTLLLAGCEGLNIGPEIKVTNNTSIPIIVGVVDPKGDKQTRSLSPGETVSTNVAEANYLVSAKAKADYAKELMSARDYLEDKRWSFLADKHYTTEEYNEILTYIKKIDEKVYSMVFGSDNTAPQCRLQIEAAGGSCEGQREEAPGKNGVAEVSQSPNGTLNVECHLVTVKAKGCGSKD